MIEPEIAFADLQDLTALSSDFVAYLAKAVLDQCQQDLAFFQQRVDSTVITRLEQLAQQSVAILTYTKAIEILESASQNFEFPVGWGIDLASEHERYIAEQYCQGPVILTDYPKGIKAFYMRQNDDRKTVAAMDLLVPGLGELIGGSQREERIEMLDLSMQGLNLSEELWWYRDLRRFGTVPHGGFGLGFERLVSYFTGMDNVRDTIAFPRVAGSAKF